MSLVTFGLGVGALVTGGLGGFYGDAPTPPAPPPIAASVYTMPPMGGAGGPGGALPGDFEFGDPVAQIGWRDGPPDPGFWLNAGRVRGAAEATQGCADAGKVLETWTSDSEPRGTSGATAGCADAGKVHDHWKAEP